MTKVNSKVDSVKKVTEKAVATTKTSKKVEIANPLKGLSSFDEFMKVTSGKKVFASKKGKLDKVEVTNFVERTPKDKAKAKAGRMVIRFHSVDKKAETGFAKKHRCIFVDRADTALVIG